MKYDGTCWNMLEHVGICWNMLGYDLMFYVKCLAVNNNIKIDIFLF